MKDLEALEFLRSENPVWDSFLIQIEIREELGRCSVDMKFSPLKASKYLAIYIKMIDVIFCRYVFECASSAQFVESAKIMQLGDGSFYLSLDPDPKSMAMVASKWVASEGDNKSFSSKNLEVFAM